MAFIVKISAIFLLSIFLLSCSSHANDHLPDVRVGNRKLLGAFNVVKGFVNGLKNIGKGPKSTVDNTKPKDIFNRPDTNKVDYPNFTNRKDVIDEDTKRLADWIVQNIQVVDEPQELGSDHNVIEATAKNVGQKLFGANGEKGFRIGWKVGKWIYKVDKKCQEFENALNVTCQHSTLTNITGMSCVVLVAGVTGSVSCNEGVLPQSVVTPQSIPCFYNNGTIYNWSGIAFDLVTQNPLKDCAINQVP